jgi:hypothetical protein
MVTRKYPHSILAHFPFPALSYSVVSQDILGKWQIKVINRQFVMVNCWTMCTPPDCGTGSFSSSWCAISSLFFCDLNLLGRKHQSKIAAQQPSKETYETPTEQVVCSHPYRYGFPLRCRIFTIWNLRRHDSWPTHQLEWLCAVPGEQFVEH